MNANWINKALEDAVKQPWSNMVDLSFAREDLEDWASDGVFKKEQDVRDRLCQWASDQIKQIGRASFRCTL